ncbi:MAG: ABC transporter ATP-binding protein [Desulfobaccales bacterium]
MITPATGLHLEEVMVTYRNHDHALLALDGVSLEVPPGRIVALVGESGSGKTTLGLACMGLLPNNAELKGRILLDGQPYQHLPETDLNRLRWSRLAMVFQNGAVNLNPVQRLIDQVAEPLVIHRGLRAPEARSQAAATLLEVGLEAELGRRYPHEVSGGQAQRVLLAMALILNPEVLILDEPTAGLDAVTRGMVAEVVCREKAKGRAILLISHDLELAARLADTVAVLYLGQIMETMPAGDLLDNPCHPYTLALVRSFPSLTATRDLGGIRGEAFYRLSHRHDRTDLYPAHIKGLKVPPENSQAPPAGCVFQSRCTQNIEACAREPVGLEAVAGHQVRCLRGGIVTLLELSRVSKRYDQTVALHPTDLSLRAGELFCLVGETGSGKTTLALIAAGVLKPDSGRRTFAGRDLDDWAHKDYRSLARRIGVIYQNPAASVSHRFNVLDIVAEPLRIHRQGRDRHETLERVRQVMTEVRLPTDPEFFARYPHELNVGALQRVCLARALILKPSLVIADEPTSSLDPSVQAKVLKMLLNLQTERGLTMLFITHDIGLARKVGDRLGVMLAGRLVEVGPTPLVLNQPFHPYTRLLLDSAGAFSPAGAPRTGEGDPHEGCPFARRCVHQQEICRQIMPHPIKRGHRLVACHYPLFHPPAAERLCSSLSVSPPKETIES